jgi:hypothetical protein
MQKSSTTGLGVLAVLLALGFMGFLWMRGQQERPLGPLDGHDLPGIDTGRVQIGDVAPDFRLPASNGDTLMLSDLRGDRDVVLVFYRGHW